MQELQGQTVVGQEMVAINNLQIPIYTHFLLNCNREKFCLMNSNSNTNSLVYIYITSSSFSFNTILKQLIHLD